jgi:hypothetical protein
MRQRWQALRLGEMPAPSTPTVIISDDSDLCIPFIDWFRAAKTTTAARMSAGISTERTTHDRITKFAA